MIALINNKLQVVTVVSNNGDRLMVQDGSGRIHYISKKENEKYNVTTNSRGIIK